MFSSHAELPLNEKSKMLPRSPYAKAKFEIHYKIQDLKNSHNWNIKSGIMFNHESEFRPNEFLIMKIISTAISIQSGSREKLSLGSLEYSRDWTYAKDMARAIEKISNESEPIDYVIGSGISHSILDIVNIVFEFFDLEYKQYLEIDSALLRKGDPVHIKSDPKLILKRLNWKANYSINEIIEQMIFSRLKLTNN
jgi:GDPmannose 4,6-dehydratase